MRPHPLFLLMVLFLPVSPATAADAPGAVLPCAEPPPRAMALGEVVELALCRHPKSRAALAEIRLQDAGVGESRAALLPTVSASLEESLRRTRTAAPSGAVVQEKNGPGLSVSLSQLLFDFGKSQATLDKTRALLAAALASRDRALQEVFLQAVRSFFALQAKTAALQAARTAEESATLAHEAARVRLEKGSGTVADRLQARTQEVQARLERVRAEGERRKAEGELANVLGLRADHPLQLTEPLEEETVVAEPPEVEQLIDRALRLRPDLTAVQARRDAARQEQRALKAATMPRLTLEATGQAEENRDSRVTGNSLSLSLKVPLFEGYAPGYRVAGAEARGDSLEVEAQRLEQQVALEVWQAWQEMRTAREAMAHTRALLESATQAERVAMGRYKAGVGLMTELLAAQSALASARKQRVESLYDWNVARATLATAMGRMEN
ncbi:MAG: TolC family protein [Magnetococcales bacterium]|nr:TolC family protein [Magnetococcales bacterium]